MACVYLWFSSFPAKYLGFQSRSTSFKWNSQHFRRKWAEEVDFGGGFSGFIPGWVFDSLKAHTWREILGQNKQEWVLTQRATEEHHLAARRVGSLCGNFMRERPIWNAAGRLCLKVQHHVRAISTDGSCLFPHSNTLKQGWRLRTTVLALVNHSPKAERPSLSLLQHSV